MDITQPAMSPELAVVIPAWNEGDNLERLLPMRLHARDFDVLEEILVRAYTQGSRIAEVPFRYMPRRSGNSHARLIRFGCAYATTLWRMWRLRYAAESLRADRSRGA